MIVLGDSILVAGITASELALTPARSAAIVVAFLGTAVFYWLYFDEVADRAAERLARAGPERGLLARDAFTYLHIPIVAGMLVTAVGNELRSRIRWSRCTARSCWPSWRVRPSTSWGMSRSSCG